MNGSAQQRRQLDPPGWARVGVWLLIAFAAQAVQSATRTEEFARDPRSHGWQVAGDGSLFQWNTNQQNLEVTWDSAQTNSFFFLPLPFALGRQDDFQLAFDLRLAQIQGGANPAKPSTFEIALGFIQVASVTQAAFNRGTGRDSPNLVEFAYFPPADIIAATVSPVIVTSNNQFRPSFNYPLELTVHDLFHVTLAFSASRQTLATRMTRNGESFSSIKDVVLGTNDADFRVDAISVNSYNDRGDAYGSVLARGTVDNMVVTWPDPPVIHLAGHWNNRIWQASCVSTRGWSYGLERAEQLPGWQMILAPQAGTGAPLIFEDRESPANGAFYRLRIERP